MIDYQYKCTSAYFRFTSDFCRLAAAFAEKATADTSGLSELGCLGFKDARIDFDIPLACNSQDGQRTGVPHLWRCGTPASCHATKLRWVFGLRKKWVGKISTLLARGRLRHGCFAGRIPATFLTVDGFYGQLIPATFWTVV